MTMANQQTADGFAIARRAMIDSQLRVSGVNNDKVLSALARVAREDHVPASSRCYAYMDRAVPLENGRQLAAPLFYGQMLEEAMISSDDKVLVVDGGSGYLPALVAPLAASVEVIDPAQATSASHKGNDYTLLLVDGAVEHLPDSLTAQLADKGRIVTGLVRNGLTRLAVGRMNAGQVSLATTAEMGIPSLPEFAVEKSWTF
ncbi:MAG: protein-L-isoaspartate O-methyltransferase [Novosphingobium sp.]|nr:protein-L-isoaspartate O-methyltransferase [Novosphingobium sp.]